jgi:two-component system, NarL family, invasion response regulator UvrY
MNSIYIVDDHAMVRDGLRSVLEHAGHRIVGEAAQVGCVVDELQRLRPHVLLLDLHLGSDSGFDVLQQVRDSDLPTRTIVVSMSERPHDVAEALRLGAAGYVLKGASARELLAAVSAVAAGGRYLGRQAAQLATQGAEREAGGGLDTLSRREREVLLLVVRGASSAAIGKQLQLSPKTVDTYRSRLMLKLGVADVPALVRLAIRERLISADEA